MLGLARLLLGAEEEDERVLGSRQLESAIREFEGMHMQPALGRAMELAATIQKSTSRRSFPESDVSTSLTAREREIADLLARGMRNRDIAGSFVISEGTVGVHVKHILGKLGLKSRGQVAAWIADHRATRLDSPQDQPGKRTGSQHRKRENHVRLIRHQLQALTSARANSRGCSVSSAPNHLAPMAVRRVRKSS